MAQAKMEVQDVNPTPEEMHRQLLAAGWKLWEGHSTIYQAPEGGIFRGPALAYHIMKGLRWSPTVSPRAKVQPR